VFPGVEVYIGKNSLAVKNEMNNVIFQLHEEDVIIKSLRKPVRL
jgi:uncharacterized protein (DUF342 family)